MEKDQFLTNSDRQIGRGALVIKGENPLTESYETLPSFEKELKILWPEHCFEEVPKSALSPEDVDVERDAQRQRDNQLTAARRYLAEARRGRSNASISLMRLCLDFAQATPDDIGTSWNELAQFGNRHFFACAATCLELLRASQHLMNYHGLRKGLRDSRALAQEFNIEPVTLESLGTTERELMQLRRRAVYQERERDLTWTWVRVGMQTDE